MHIDGACHCGAIAYTAHIDPAKAAICHCTDCQTLSGAPFRASVPARVEDFTLLRGLPRLYIKTAQSGAKRVQAFCETCGTPIYATALDNPAILNLRLGPVTQRAALPARRRIWCGSALDWANDISALPGSEKA